MTFPAPANPNYTVTVSGTLHDRVYGGGLAARATVTGSSAVGHAIQYDPGIGGFRDNDYPSDNGPAIATATDTTWHTLCITVNGDSYTESAVGTKVASGMLPQAAESTGGVLIRIWDGAAVELTTPVITPIG